MTPAQTGMGCRWRRGPMSRGTTGALLCPRCDAAPHEPKAAPAGDLPTQEQIDVFLAPRCDRGVHVGPKTRFQCDLKAGHPDMHVAQVNGAVHRWRA